MGQLGISFTRLSHSQRPSEEGASQEHQAEAETKTAGNNAAFTLDDLMLQWLAMCNRMPQQYSGLAARMKNMNPAILDMPAVEVVVPNEIILTEMEQIKGRLLRTLKDNLHNSEITLSLRVAEQGEKVKILTRREQFEQLSKDNEAVEKLRAAFDLELA